MEGGVGRNTSRSIVDVTTFLTLKAGCYGAGTIVIDISAGGTTVSKTGLDCGIPTRTTEQPLGRFEKGTRFTVTVDGRNGPAVYYAQVERGR